MTATEPTRRARAALRAAERAGDRHRHRPPRDRRVHPRPARAGRLRARRPRPVGRHRFGGRRVPRGRGDRGRPAAGGDDAVPDIVAGLADRCRVGHRGARLRQRAGRHQPDGRWLLRDRDDAWCGGTRGADRHATASRQLRRPDADGRRVRPVGDVGRAGRRDRQQDRVAHRLHDVVRRLGLRVQPDRRPVQEPGPPAGGRARRPRRDRPQGADAPTCGPARPTRSRAGSATRSSIGCSSGGSTSGGRSRRWPGSASNPPSSSGSTGWSPAPNSSARSRRSPSSGRERPASTTSTRDGGRGRRAGDGRGVRGRPRSRRRAACCTWSPPRSGTWAT